MKFKKCIVGIMICGLLIGQSSIVYAEEKSDLDDWKE